MLEKFRFRRVLKSHLGLFYKAQACSRVLLYPEVFPQPLGCFYTNASSRMSVSMAAGQCCLFSFCSFLSLSLSLSHTHTHIHTHTHTHTHTDTHTVTQLKRGTFLNSGELWVVYLERVPESTLSGYFPLPRWRKGEGIGKEKPSLQIEWKWKHCKVNSWKYHKCHSPFTKTVFRQHNNPVQHLFCLRDYYSTILPFHLPWRSVISLIIILCLSQALGVRLIQMMTWGDWSEGCWQPGKPREDSHAFSVATQLQMTAL